MSRSIDEEVAAILAIPVGSSVARRNRMQPRVRKNVFASSHWRSKAEVWKARVNAFLLMHEEAAAVIAAEGEDSCVELEPLSTKLIAQGAGLKLPGGDWTRADELLVETIMRSAGYESRQRRDGRELIREWVRVASESPMQPSAPPSDAVEFAEHLLRAAAPALRAVDLMRIGPLTEAQRTEAIASLDAFIQAGGGFLIGMDDPPASGDLPASRRCAKTAEVPF